MQQTSAAWKALWAAGNARLESAAVIGGVSTSGGSGRVRDAVLGAFLVCGLTNVMNLLNVSDYYTTLIKGGIIIGAMGIASFRQQQAAKKGV